MISIPIILFVLLAIFTFLFFILIIWALMKASEDKKDYEEYLEEEYGEESSTKKGN